MPLTGQVEQLNLTSCVIIWDKQLWEIDAIALKHILIENITAIQEEENCFFRAKKTLNGGKSGYKM